MTFSIKEIESKLGSRIIQISIMGWVEVYGHLIGKLLKDPYTGKIHLRTNAVASGTSIEYRMKFLSEFKYTQHLCCFNMYFNSFLYIVELHGFREDV